MSRPLFKTGEFDDLIAIEIESTPERPFHRDVRGVLLTELERGDVKFYPAASCARQIYIIRKSDLAASKNNPTLQRFIFGDLKHDLITFHEGDKAIDLMTRWISGGLNENKFFHDTFNKKTVEIDFSCYREMCKNPYFAERRIYDIREKLKELESLDKTESTKAKIDWLKLEEKSIIKFKALLKSEAANAPRDFLDLIARAFEVSYGLSSVIQSLKEESDFRELWSKPITKPTIEGALKSGDEDTVSDILFTRVMFVKIATECAVSAAQTNSSHADIKATIMSNREGFIRETFCDSFRANIAELSSLVKSKEVKKLQAQTSDKSLGDNA